MRASRGAAAPAMTPPCCCSRARPDSASGTGRSGGPHVAWSGNQPTWPNGCPTARAPAGAASWAVASCCCRARCGSTLGRPTPVRGCASPTRPKVWTAPPRGCTAGCGPGPGTRAERGRWCSTPGRPSTSSTTSTDSPRSPSRRRHRGRAVRAGRRVVPASPRRLGRAGGLVRRRGRVARRVAPAGRPCPGVGHGVRSLVRAGDGESRLRPRPGPPGLAARRPPSLAWRRQQVLDLANPGAFGYLLDRISAWSARSASRTSSGITTVTCSRPWPRASTAVRRPGCTPRRRRPTRCSTSCAAGTRRWRSSRAPPVAPGRPGHPGAHRPGLASDTNDALERQAIQRWTGLLVPPELVGAHVGPPVAHTTGRTAGPHLSGA